MTEQAITPKQTPVGEKSHKKHSAPPINITSGTNLRAGVTYKDIFKRSLHFGTIFVDPDIKMLALSNFFVISQMFFVCTKLKIADLLQEGAKHSDELARLTGTDKGALERLLRALCELDVLIEEQPGLFKITEMAKFLVETRSGSIYNLVLSRS